MSWQTMTRKQLIDFLDDYGYINLDDASTVWLRDEARQIQET